MARKDNRSRFLSSATKTLVKEFERVLGSTQPNSLEIEKLKKLLKEHEQSLIQAISDLADAPALKIEHHSETAMAVVFSDLNSAAGLKKLDDYLLTRSYITGYQASQDDLTVYTALLSPPSAEYVNASRWFLHVDALLRLSGVTSDGCGVKVEAFAPSKVVDDDFVCDSDDEVDLFDDKYDETEEIWMCRQ